MFISDTNRRKEIQNDRDKKHFQARNRDSWPWKEEAKTQQGIRQHRKGPGDVTSSLCLMPLRSRMQQKTDTKKTQDMTEPRQKNISLFLTQHCLRWYQETVIFTGLQAHEATTS